MIDIGHPELPIQLRLVQVEDVPSIYEIKRNQDVAKNQYRQSPLDIPKAYIRIFLSHDGRPGSFRAWSIISEQRVIGHIEGCPRFDRSLTLGFNLHPEHWGRGIMSRTLNALIQDLHTKDNIRTIVCDCFGDNMRCRSLLKRLNFTPGKMGLVERFNILLVNRCVRPIIRHRRCMKTVTLGQQAAVDSTENAL